MDNQSIINFAVLYRNFNSPIAKLDCGDHCAPFNELGVPFCCDIRYAIPTALNQEWDFLKVNTDLWKAWCPENEDEFVRLKAQTPAYHELIVCKGHLHCQREFRSLTCRSFPFFPYITKEGDFIGLSYYWEYEEQCWVISNLQVVTQEYIREFIQTYEYLLSIFPDELEVFRQYSIIMRRVFGRKGRAITLLHRNGNCYKIAPRNGKLRKVDIERLPKFGNYKIVAQMPFPDEE